MSTPFWTRRAETLMSLNCHDNYISHRARWRIAIFGHETIEESPHICQSAWLGITYSRIVLLMRYAARRLAGLDEIDAEIDSAPNSHACVRKNPPVLVCKCRLQVL